MRKHFTDQEDAAYREMVEGYELSDGTAIFAAVEFEFSPKHGLMPMKKIYLDEAGYNIQMNDFPYHDQVWLDRAVEKDVENHIREMYEQAEEAYIKLISGRREYYADSDI